MEGTGDGHVVRGPERLAAQVVEGEPGNAARLFRDLHLPAMDRERSRIASRPAGQRLEGGIEGCASGVVRRDVPDGGAAELFQPEIRAGIEAQHRDAPLQLLDKGQEQGAVQATLVEPVGLDVRGRHHRHAPAEQVSEETAQDHRIGDVGDRELIEAQERRLVGKLIGDGADRVVALHLATLERLPVGVDALVGVGEEAVEVHPPLRTRRGLVEQVHEHGLAAADRAPDVEPGTCSGSSFRLNNQPSALPLLARLRRVSPCTIPSRALTAATWAESLSIVPVAIRAS